MRKIVRACRATARPKGTAVSTALHWPHAIMADKAKKKRQQRKETKLLSTKPSITWEGVVIGQRAAIGAKKKRGERSKRKATPQDDVESPCLVLFLCQSASFHAVHVLFG